MKALAVFVILLAFLQTVSLFHIIKQEWTPYKLKNDKEEKFCMKIFMENCTQFAKYNERYKMGSMTYNLDINKYVDMSNPDFVETLKNFNQKFYLNADIKRAKGLSGGTTILNSAMPIVHADISQQKIKIAIFKINNLQTNYLKRKKRFAFLGALGVLLGSGIGGVSDIGREQNLIRTKIEFHKEKIQAEKQYLRSLEIENKFKEERERTKVVMENIILNKEKEILKSLEIENKNQEIIGAIKLQIERIILLEIEEARRSIILQKNRLERQINRLENELNELENELYALKMEKNEENMKKIRYIEEKIENIEENIIKLGADIINYSRLSLANNNK